MSERHVPAGDLERYVMGALARDASAALERHVLSCGACAARLAGEARLEMAMHEVALASPDMAASLPAIRLGPRGMLRAARAGLVGAAAMAVAAAALMALPARATRGAGADPTESYGSRSESSGAAVVCPDAADGATCGDAVRVADAAH